MTFDLRLAGKTAIITGASDGLGLATAKRFVAEGANVVMSARRAAHLEAAVETAAASGEGDAIACAGDVTRAEDCEALVAAAEARFGGVDILVNNAGASAAQALETLEDAAWEADFQLKVMAAVRMCRLTVPLMRRAGGGAIVNASIGGGKAPAPQALPTSVMRSAGLNLTKSLAGEFAADNIRVNAICIGLLKSAQWERRAAGGDLSAFYDQLAAKVPMGRVGEAEDYADLAAFLCSARAAYITGTAVNLDGGMCPTL
ncbi:MAG: SDR family oxidoreductase [Pseudomonadota bacterium]